MQSVIIYVCYDNSFHQFLKNNSYTCIKIVDWKEHSKSSISTWSSTSQISLSTVKERSITTLKITDIPSKNEVVIFILTCLYLLPPSTSPSSNSGRELKHSKYGSHSALKTSTGDRIFTSIKMVDKSTMTVLVILLSYPLPRKDIVYPHLNIKQFSLLIQTPFVDRNKAIP